jgi:hypothetical protein
LFDGCPERFKHFEAAASAIPKPRECPLIAAQDAECPHIVYAFQETT